ncbi:MAG: hypothetical protein L3J02_02965 [Henriciella sp.]|nr:hypothetical protein [Henriciella sp.]
MKRIIVLAVALLALAACGGKQAKLQGLCTGMLEGDPDASRHLARSGTTARPFCECYAQTASAGGDAVVKLHTSVWSALSEISRRTGRADIESAAETLEDALRSGAGAYDFGETAFEAVDEYLEDIIEQFDDNGTCAL